MKGWGNLFLKLFKYYKLEKNLFFLDFGCAILLATLQLFYPTEVRRLINEVIPSKDFNEVIKLGIFLVIIFLLIFICSYIVSYYGHFMGVKIEYRMRKDLFQHIQKLSFSYFDNNKTGHIMSRLVNDLNDISEFAHHGPEDLFLIIINLLGAVIIMFTINVKLTLVTVIVMPFAIIFFVRQNLKLRKNFKELRKNLADINAQAESSISGIRVVKAFNNEDFEIKKFESGNYKFRQSKESAYKIMAGFHAGIELFSNCLNLMIIVFAASLIIRGEMSPGDMVAFLLYVAMFIQPIKNVATFIEMYQRGTSSIDRFYEILDIEPDVKDASCAKDIGRLHGNLQFNDVSFSYGNNNFVVKNLNLSIGCKQTIALVGPSGVGKTTICSLIPRFYEISQGVITIDDIDTKDMTLASLRDNIGIVQQDVFLFSGTVKENIAYGKLNATDAEIIDAAKKAQAHEFIMSLKDGYNTYIGERGVKLSGGQKQRLSIARIFLKNPPILILDEATSALDSETEVLIQKSFDDLSKDRTTIVIAHRLGTILNADRILFLSTNGVEESGSHEELINKKGLYYKLYSTQFKQVI